MRKKLKILFYILSALFFYNWLIPIKINIEAFYIKLAYVSFLIPYMIYEVRQLTNDDKIRGTYFFVNRSYLVIFWSVILLLLIFLSK
jgi:hypothetical protein